MKGDLSMKDEQREAEERRMYEEMGLMKVLSLVSSNALFPESGSLFTPDLIEKDIASIDKRGERIARYISLIKGGEDVTTPFPYISDVIESVENGARDLSGEGVYRAHLFVSSFLNMLRFEKATDRIRHSWVDFIDEVSKTLLPDGNVDESNPRLLPFLEKIESAKRRRREYSESFIRENSAILTSNTPFYHSGRFIFQVNAYERSKVPGYVEGESGSGKALYVEPFALVDLNNDVFLSEERLSKEKKRILEELVEMLSSLIDEIVQMRAEVLDFDLHHAFSVYLIKIKANRMMHGEKVSLLSARHPLVENPVPIDFSIGDGIKGVVISGANAGGKTVTMKTVALLSMLNQITGFAPADGKSELPIFSSFLSDIGDWQSIEEKESTFSSHMLHVKNIEDLADCDSLVILDELCSGTDPEEGSYLALSILEYFSKHAALTLVTSHYSLLKERAYGEDYLMNASMSFDEERGIPTYKVIINAPGESHALKIARNKGLSEEIIRRYEELSEGKKDSVSNLIGKLTREKKELDEELESLKAERGRLEAKRKVMEKEEKELKEKLLSLDRKSLDEYSSIIRKGRSTIENLVKAIRENKADDSSVKEAKKELDALFEEKEREEKRLDESSVHTQSFSVGDEVSCGKLGKRGKVLAVGKKGQYLVLLEGGLKITLPSDQLKLNDKKGSKASVSYDISKFKNKKASYTIDVRGKKLEDALKVVQDEIEEATLSSLSSFVIIHGLGDGVLMRGIHEYLKKRRDVASYYFARPEDGGMGKTYVELQ